MTTTSPAKNPTSLPPSQHTGDDGVKIGGGAVVYSSNGCILPPSSGTASRVGDRVACTTYLTTTTTTTTVLMIVSVGRMLLLAGGTSSSSSLLLGYLRSAGSKGLAVFEEMVALDVVPARIDVVNHHHMCQTTLLPMNTAASKISLPVKLRTSRFGGRDLIKINNKAISKMMLTAAVGTSKTTTIPPPPSAITTVTLSQRAILFLYPNIKDDQTNTTYFIYPRIKYNRHDDDENMAAGYLSSSQEDKRRTKRNNEADDMFASPPDDDPVDAGTVTSSSLSPFHPYILTNDAIAIMKRICSGNHHVELGAGFDQLTTIRDGFMSNCVTLQNLLLFSEDDDDEYRPSSLSSPPQLPPSPSPFSNVTSIGSSFMSGCIYFSTTTTASSFFSVFRNVTTIGDEFMSSTHCIQNGHEHRNGNEEGEGQDIKKEGGGVVDLSPLVNITSIGNAFFKGCGRGMRFVRLPNRIEYEGAGSLSDRAGSCITSSSPLLTVGNEFFADCIYLERVVAGGGAREVGDSSYPQSTRDPQEEKNRLGKAPPGEEERDSASLRVVDQVGHSMFLGCKSLTSSSSTLLDLSLLLTGITHINNWFLARCDGRLEKLVARDLTNMEVVGGNGKTAEVAKTMGVVIVGGITHLNLTPLGNVTTIQNHFLCGLELLGPTIDLTPLRNVTHIGDGFMAECKGLLSLDTSPLLNLKSVGSSFLSGCSRLTQVILPEWKNVENRSVPSHFMNRCVSLTTVDLLPLRHVTSIQPNFLSGCSGLTTLDLGVFAEEVVRRSAAAGGGFVEGCVGINNCRR